MENKRVKEILNFAKALAEERKDFVVDTDHLLLALFKVKEDNPFRKWLLEHEVNPDAAEREIEKIISNLQNQISKITDSFKEALITKKEELTDRHGATFSKSIVEAFLDHLTTQLEKEAKGERERDFATVRVRRWVPTRSRTFSLFEDLFSDIFEEFFPSESTGNWVMREETIRGTKVFRQ